MSAPLSAELRAEHNVRSMPVRQGDEVEVTRGTYKAHTGKVVSVYHKKWVIHIDRLTKAAANGKTPFVGIHPSNVKIVKLEMNRDRQDILNRKAAGRTAALEKSKGKLDQE